MKFSKLRNNNVKKAETNLQQFRGESQNKWWFNLTDLSFYYLWHFHIHQDSKSAEYHLTVYFHRLVEAILHDDQIAAKAIKQNWNITFKDHLN